jgi:hypothetical protein
MIRRPSILAAGIVAALAIACSDSTGPGDEGGNPLLALSKTAAADSGGNVVPQPASSTTPGIFRGTVMGQSAPGAGNDSLNTAPRVAGAVITAYPTTQPGSPNPTLQPAAATVTTGADGKFTLPSLPGGAYVVTITPPSGSIYAGVWVTATAHSGSGEFPWWVVLPKK